MFTRVIALFGAFSVRTEIDALSSKVDGRMNTVVVGFSVTDDVVSVGVASSTLDPTPTVSPFVKLFL